MSETIRLHRCHHCATESCPAFGHRRIVEGGCPEYTRLDPLKRRSWGEYENTRRIRKTTSMKFEPENIDFINDFILPSDEKMLQGYFTRGVHYVVDMCLEHYGDDYPVIPPLERESEFCRVERKVTFLPETLEKVSAIRAHWKGTPHATTNSQIVNHFISLTRDMVLGTED